MRRFLNQFGPGILVTAAFIGPGTITTASIAGANYGYTLLWALLFSVMATIALQEMTVRLGLIGRRDLAEALRVSFGAHWYGRAAIVLVIAAIGLGNAAYEAGNITGAALGLQSISGIGVQTWSLAVGLLAALLLAGGRYRLIERILIALVLLMSLVFLATLAMLGPAPAEIFRGLLLPQIPKGSLLTIIALIGTTVVPYNLFLHASSVREKWPDSVERSEALRAARLDTGLSIGLGGLITLAVMSTAAAAFFGSPGSFSAASMAQQLEPLLGAGARYFFAAGLFAAGLSSAVTAPLAAAYAVGGALGWHRDIRSLRMRAVWLAVLICGTGLATLGIKPLTAILFAQAANGFLLPLCALFLLMVMNQRSVLGDYANHAIANVLGGIVVLVTLALSLLKIAGVLGWSDVFA